MRRLMLLTQQGAAWHEIAHWQRGHQQQQQQRKDTADKLLCERCLAFAQIAVKKRA